MPARPAILDSSLIRIICPRKQRSRCFTTTSYQLPKNQPWSHPPSSISIDNDQVARLASQSLHHLTLADLVRYHLSLIYSPSYTTIHLTDRTLPVMALHPSPHQPSSPPPTSPSLSCPSASPTEFKPSATSHSLSSPIHTSPASTTTTSTPSRHYSPTKSGKSIP